MLETESNKNRVDVNILEREPYLAALNAALAESGTNGGRIALISGEAGIGKSTLIELFVRSHRNKLPVYWGGCDLLFTPRPLGPLHDMAQQIGGRLPGLLDTDGNRSAIYSTFLSELGERTKIAVFEDLHWADEATLDLLQFVCRRINQTSALLVLIYRDDELSPRHPLRMLLGDLASSPAVRRIQLEPLSRSAVMLIVGQRGIDPIALHRQTRGNPFYITEVLAGAGIGIPPTIRDAVLARMARLSPSGQAVLEAAAVIGQRVGPKLLAEVTGAEAQAVDECIAVGMLEVQDEALTFRHELARQTVLETISPLRKQVLHRLVLQVLKSSPASRNDLARLAHHAEATGDREAVLEYAPAAAKRASAAGAHREAAALYALALRFAGDQPLEERARLFESHAWESNLIDQQSESIASRKQAIELWRQVGNPLRQGDNLAEMALTLFGSGSSAETLQTSQAAIDILESLPPGRELALAYRTKALLSAFDHNHTEAISLSEKSVALAERFDDVRVMAMAYDTLGTTYLYVDYQHGCKILEDCLALALRAGLEARVATVYGNWGATACDLYRLEDARQNLEKGIEYSADRDLDLIRMHLLAWQALTHLYLGHWSEAGEIVSEVIIRPEVTAINRIPALVALGRLSARRGDPDPQATLDEALELANRAYAFQNIGPVRSARAEAAWLAGDRRRTLLEARAGYDLAVNKRHPWIAGELAYWLWRTGDAVEIQPWMAEPFALQIAGDWSAAAKAWEQQNCPYEQARALADGDVESQMASLEIFERLGARPDLYQVRRKLLTTGVHNLPRGPRPATRQNPFNLTNRQVEILALLTESLTNAEIAARLHISPKTVDHHVSAILAKLDVHSREEAARIAR